MRRRVLMGAADDLRHRRAKAAAMGEPLDEWGVVGAEIAEQIVDTDLGQPSRKR
jgi:hypothetical protein